MDRPEILHDFSILEANIYAKGTNELLNEICNIIQQRNSKVMEETYLHLKESVNHAQPRAHTV